MPNDNVVLNPGTGGVTVATLADAASVEWPACVATYATTVSPGANALQVVTTAHGLPVAQQGTWTVGVSGPVAVTGTFFQATQPVSLSGAVTVVGTGTFAVQASQGGTWSARVQDGSGNALTSLSVGAQRSITVAIVDASGNQITSFGGAGGTSSTFGSAFPATGTATGFKDSSGTNMVAGNLDSSGNLKVNVAAGGASGGTSSTYAAAFPATGTASGFSDGTNMQAARVFDADSGGGTQYVVGVNLRGSSSGGSVEIATSSNPLRTDPTGTTTQPVSAASLPLPAGASTAAKQPAIGTAGTASADVITIQGVASMTAVKVDGSGVTQPVSGTVTANAGTGTFGVSGTVTANIGTSGSLALDASVSGLLVSQGSTTSGEKGPLAQGAVTTAAPSYTTAQTSPLSLDTGGNLRVLATASGTYTVSGTVTANVGTTNGLALDATLTAGTMKSKLVDTGGTNVATVSAGGALKVDGSAATQPVSGTVTAAQATAASLNATVVGTGTFAVQAAQSGTWTVQPGNTANTTPWLANHADPAATTGNITVVDSGTSSASGQGGQSLITGSPTASSSVSCTFSAHAAVAIQVTGTWTGTLSFERSIDGGTTFTPTSLILYGVPGGALATITGNGILHANVGANTQVRVRATAAMTGTAAVRVQPGFGEGVIPSAPAGYSAAQSGALTGTPAYAAIVASSGGATTIVSATAGKRIVVLRWSLSANGSVNVKWQSHVTPTDLTGLHYLVQFASAGGAYCPAGIFQTVSGEALDINLSGAVAVGGELTYVLV